MGADESERTSEQSSKVEIPSLLKHSPELFGGEDAQNLQVQVLKVEPSLAS